MVVCQDLRWGLHGMIGEQTIKKNREGSVWHRWDPHIHAPGTIKNDGFGGDNDVFDNYIALINSADPPIRALGVTDYYILDSYERVYTAGLVLVRQKPGSAKGVMFITIEDETGPANVVVWPTLFEKRRRIVLGSSMMAINGRIQREGEVVHLVAQQLFDLSGDLVGLADRDTAFKLPAGRGDEFAHGGGGPDSCDRPKPVVARDLFTPDLHIDTLKIKSRNFH